MSGLLTCADPHSSCETVRSAHIEAVFKDSVSAPALELVAQPATGAVLAADSQVVRGIQAVDASALRSRVARIGGSYRI